MSCGEVTAGASGMVGAADAAADGSAAVDGGAVGGADGSSALKCAHLSFA